MAAKKDRVLWADDEIDLLKPHILFLQDKGYEVIPVISGQDAIECCKEESFDIIFLDENMPGLTGLETLAQIKAINPDVPVVMVTKSEEESIMNQAIGNKIGGRLENRRLPDQTGQSEPAALVYQEECPQERNHIRNNDCRLSAGVRAYRHADQRLTDNR